MSLTGVIRLIINSLRGPRMLKPGDAAPEFEAPTHEGRRVKLADLRGKKVVLWFYPKADTPG